jgi:dTDP-4-dehydrorhamnose reductase
VRLARRLAGDGAFVVFLSTNLVYDGSVPLRRADEATCPVTEYGRQKAAVERALLAAGAAVSIVRLTKVVTGEVMPFRGWLQALQNRESIYPFADMVMAPVPLSFAIEALHRIADRRLEGIVQVSAERDISFADAARRLASRMSAPLDLVRPVSAAEAGRSFEVMPKHTTLDTSRLRVEVEMTPPEAWCAIDEVA